MGGLKYLLKRGPWKTTAFDWTNAGCIARLSYDSKTPFTVEEHPEKDKWQVTSGVLNVCWVFKSEVELAIRKQITILR